MSKTLREYTRAQVKTLADRLIERRQFIQVISGPRQVGKTTLIRQIEKSLGIPLRYASADEPGERGTGWIAQQWEAGRLLAAGSSKLGAVLALDEIQKISGWSETIKRLWDEDSASALNLKVVILGSAPLLVRLGLAESLAGRFELLNLRHWSFVEMRDAFGWDVEQYIYYGGFPGSASLTGDPIRWKAYIRDSLIETTISRDLLQLTRIDKPALLRRVFELSCRYSGQILSYTKMLGQLLDAGNTTTLAHYLELLADAGMAVGIPKYAGDTARRRGSSPKLQVLNNALMTAESALSFEEARKDGGYWGRLVESAVGAHLANAAATGTCQVFYWREGDREVDFVLRWGSRLAAIEVKSGRVARSMAGMDAFRSTFNPTQCILVGGDGIPIEEFLALPAETWMRG
jgi:uncharacterized protein